MVVVELTRLHHLRIALVETQSTDLADALQETLSAVLAVLAVLAVALSEHTVLYTGRLNV